MQLWFFFFLNQLSNDDYKTLFSLGKSAQVHSFCKFGHMIARFVTWSVKVESHQAMKLICWEKWCRISHFTWILCFAQLFCVELSRKHVQCLCVVNLFMFFHILPLTFSCNGFASRFITVALFCNACICGVLSLQKLLFSKSFSSFFNGLAFVLRWLMWDWTTATHGYWFEKVFHQFFLIFIVIVLFLFLCLMCVTLSGLSFLAFYQPFHSCKGSFVTFVLLFLVLLRL